MGEGRDHEVKVANERKKENGDEWGLRSGKQDESGVHTVCSQTKGSRTWHQVNSSSEVI